MRSMRPFLMFEGSAEQAMNFYVSVFSGAAILEITRYGAGEPGARLGETRKFFGSGQTVLCIDSL